MGASAGLAMVLAGFYLVLLPSTLAASLLTNYTSIKPQGLIYSVREVFLGIFPLRHLKHILQKWWTGFANLPSLWSCLDKRPLRSVMWHNWQNKLLFTEEHVKSWQVRQAAGLACWVPWDFRGCIFVDSMCASDEFCDILGTAEGAL